MFPGRPTPRWLPWVAGLATLVVLGAGALMLYLDKRNGNVSNPNVEFSIQPAPTTTQPPPPAKVGARHDAVFEWPDYGYDKARTRFFALRDPAALHPPYTARWALNGSTLLEFPPVMGARSLYLLKNNGALYGISRRTGKPLWKRRLGALAAASPAYAHDSVFVVLLSRGNAKNAGRIVAVSARDGRTRWSRKLPSRAESSPLYDRGRVIFGTEDGTVYKLRANDGSIVWTYRASGAVKGGVAEDGGGNLYFGDYSGHVTSIRVADGSKRWEAGTSGGTLGLSAGGFYSTPAVAYNRVYLGNTDGKVYSFGAATGRLAWRHGTGSYVYSSPAVGQVPGGQPTVWIGSYDSNLYALDARTGRPRWTHHADGKISGGVQVLGDLVFYSTLSRTTTALGARTGTPVWHTTRGAFNPVVSDGRRIYLVGYSSLFGLTPTKTLRHGKPAPTAAKPTAAKPRRPAHIVRRYRCLRHARHQCVRFAHRPPARPGHRPHCLKHRRGLCVRVVPRRSQGRRR